MSGARLNPLLGVARLARGRVDGLAQFGGTPQSFLASLAPLIAFPLVGTALVLDRVGLEGALALLLFSVVAQLAPPVLSHAVARYWDREDWWCRYATAFNWCQCALPLAAVPLAIGMQLAVGLGLSAEGALRLGVVAFVGYMLWLQWLLARHGLDLSRGRAAVVVGLVSVGTFALAVGPLLVMGWLGTGSPGSAPPTG